LTKGDISVADTGKVNQAKRAIIKGIATKSMENLADITVF
jgi:hypothetical protein